MKEKLFFCVAALVLLIDCALLDPKPISLVSAETAKVTDSSKALSTEEVYASCNHESLWELYDFGVAGNTV